MKMMPMARDESRSRPANVAAPLPYKARNFARDEAPRKSYRKDKRRRRKPLSRKLFEEIWDVVEDIFD